MQVQLALPAGVELRAGVAGGVVDAVRLRQQVPVGPAVVRHLHEETPIFKYSSTRRPPAHTCFEGCTGAWCCQETVWAESNNGTQLRSHTKASGFVHSKAAPEGRKQKQHTMDLRYFS